MGHAVMFLVLIDRLSQFYALFNLIYAVFIFGVIVISKIQIFTISLVGDPIGCLLKRLRYVFCIMYFAQLNIVLNFHDNTDVGLILGRSARLQMFLF
jgi:hypothetical protein